MENLSIVSNQRHDLQNKYEETNTRLNQEKSKTATLNQILQGHQAKNKAYKEKYFKVFDELLKAPQRDYKKLFCYLVERVESLYECPLSFEKLTRPAILPSGNTIDQQF